MKEKLIWTVSLFLLALQFAFAQEKTVTGTVKDVSGVPLPGVTVTVKGTTRGVATDFDGNYSIKAKAGDVLNFLGIGLRAVDKKVSASTTKIDVVMEEEAEELGEVVVTGYSVIKKSEFVGTATQVNMGSIETKSSSSVAQALTGEVAGVRVVNTTGQPGSSPEIRIRGFGSVNGNRDPLYIVDGVPFFGTIASINPEDVESTTILKDASATAIYGARGANGVVVITTKSGKVNNDYIQVESKVGYNTSFIPRYDIVQSPEEYVGISWGALYNYGVLEGNADPAQFASDNLFAKLGIAPHYNIWNAEGKDLIDPSTRTMREGITRKYTPERWLDYAFKPALRMEHNLGMGGGAGKTTYYASVGHLKDQGYSINSDYERITARLNAAFKPKTWLSGNFTLGYAHSKTRNAGQSRNANSIFWFVDNIPPIYPLFERDANGNLIPDPHYGGYVYDFGEKDRAFAALTNSVAQAVYDKQELKRNEMNAAFSLRADIYKGFSFDMRFGGQYYNGAQDILRNPYYGSAKGDRGSIYKRRMETLNWNFLQMLRYSTRVKNHGIEAFVAHETNSYDHKTLSGTKTGLANPEIPEYNNAIVQLPMDSYTEGYTLESYFGQANYDYLSKYFLSATVRRDGSSRFLKDKWDTFYSFGASWVLSKEDFMKSFDKIDNLKLKASYGVNGEQAGVGYYPGYNKYNLSNLEGLIAAPFDRGGYPDLTWETSRMFQVGAELEMFKGRLEVSLDVYKKTTDNLIFDKRLAPSTGNAIYKDNDGILINKGLEFAVRGTLLKTKDFFLDLGINGESFTNKLIEMPFDQSINARKILDISGDYGRAEGYSLYDFYMKEWVGVNQSTGASQWVVHYQDKNGDGKFNSGEQIASLYEFQKKNPNATILEGVTEVYSEATEKYINKSIIPDVRGAINLNVGYKGFTLGAQMLYSIGGYAYDGAYATLMGNSKVGGNNWHKDIHKSWKKAGDVTDVPALTSAHSSRPNQSSSSTRFLTKADYFILNNLSLGYNVPSQFLEKTGFSSLGFTLSGDNLWLSSARQGFNPSTSETGESSRYRYDPVTTFTLGVKAKF
ncbi:MAG: SusC/RagA family TonB-linked outer membrane protein [Capnocytophaga felis]|nr:SusC/RagA family TonB-linked outer membrane protein [Capnocytophaga felis]